MTVTGSTGGYGTKAISNRYPVTEGTTAATTKQTGKTMNLQPSKSYIKDSERIGIEY